MFGESGSLDVVEAAKLTCVAVLTFGPDVLSLDDGFPDAIPPILRKLSRSGLTAVLLVNAGERVDTGRCSSSIGGVLN